MKVEPFLDYEAHRRDAFQLVSTCYYQPDENAIQVLTELERALTRVCAEAVEHVTKMKEMADIEQLRVDYARLFVGPFELLAPPYGSVYLEGERRVMGDSTLDASNRYQEVGLDFSGGVKEAPDHIAIELEFMYYLIFKEIESIENYDLESAMDSLRKQKRFLEDHLGAWVSDFADSAEENAGTDFYKSLARATKIFVQKELYGISEVSIAGLSALAKAG